MDQEKIGKFIATLRNEKHLTQSQLGDMLGISDKSVSKWERGIQMPDLSNLSLLSEIFEISIDEILAAKRIDNKKVKDKNKIFLLGIKFYNHRLKKKMIKIIIMICFIFSFITVGLFFASNFNKSRVYKVFSADNGYDFSGYLVYNQKQNILMITGITMQDNLYGTEYDVDVIKVKIEVVYNDRVLVTKPIYIKEKMSLSEALYNHSIILDDDKGNNVNVINYKTDLSKIKLKITYYYEYDEEGCIYIPLKFKEIFSNDKVLY